MKSNIDFNTKDVDGFLSKTPPLKQINTSCKKIKLVQSLASNLPKLMLTNKIRPSIDELSKDSLGINFKKLNERELRLLNVQLSFIGHAYVYGGAKPLSTIPAVLAQPWVEISNLLGRPAVLSYASYCLDNWFKINEDEPVSLENVALIHNFLGGIDEDWFVTIHVCIENAAKNSINSAVQIANLFEKNLANKEHVHVNLKKLKESFIEINHIFRKMPEKCDPYIYYHRVRPYIFGWKNNPDLPKGMVYEGCFNNQPQFYRGETGAQSSIVPTMDALFNVSHERDELRDYLDEMRGYMPPAHRKLIEYVEKNSKLKDIIKGSHELEELYNDSLVEISAFRAQHLQYAADYIHKQNTKSTLFGSGGSVVRGTGGTPFMKYLKKHKDETDKTKLDSNK
tara:strand:+ start:2331 stop:3518 length:1188 start_codon:yes stop_codon:yes gene_type:complete